MADTTISGLNSLAPSTNTFVPISNGSTTGKAIYNPIPLGGIIMWSGSVASIPSGWSLCNGQTVNGLTTPNLTNRFIIGAGNSYTPNDQGGSSTFTPTGTVGNTTLTVSQIPSTPVKVFDGYDYFSLFGTGGGGGPGYWLRPGIEVTNAYNTGGTEVLATGGGGSHTHSFAGTSQTSLPPYYALAYIMRTT